VKLSHAIDFLCDDMKVKLSLRFRGREMAHQEFGFKVVNNFIKETAPYGHADSPPKLNGKSINVMLSPHPRNKRAKNPREMSIPLEPMRDEVHEDDDDDDDQGEHEAPAPEPPKSKGKQVPINAAEQPSNFGNNAFAKLNITPEEQAPQA
jgi:translation initiation factor IF-3